MARPMETRHLRERAERRSRLDPEWFHLFSLGEFARALRAEDEYRADGRNGVLLIKADRMSVVLEVAAEGTEIREHVVDGPAVVYVIEGFLTLCAEDESRAARAGELVHIPHDRPRSMRAESDAVFLWVISVEGA